MWCLIAGYFARFVGPSYQVIAFAFLQSVYLFGYFYERWSASDSYKVSKGKVSRMNPSINFDDELLYKYLFLDRATPFFSGSANEECYQQ